KEYHYPTPSLFFYFSYLLMPFPTNTYSLNVTLPIYLYTACREVCFGGRPLAHPVTVLVLCLPFNAFANYDILIKFEVLSFTSTRLVGKPVLKEDNLPTP